MEVTSLAYLLSAGLAAGFLAGLLGVGGGILFVPALYLFYESIGLPVEVATPLTLGSSFFCTFVASSVSGWHQHRAKSVNLRVAALTGSFSFLSIYLMTRLVTTQPWYSGQVFQIVFSTLLLAVVFSMVWRDVNPKDRQQVAQELADPAPPQPQTNWLLLAGVGLLVGIVAAAAGVGGGVIMVPAFTVLVGLPIRTAVGTSSGAIVLTSIAGIASYAISGLDAPVPATAFGYVDVGHAVVLALPSIITARLGVRTAQRIKTRALRLAFAVFATLIALRLIWDAIG